MISLKLKAIAFYIDKTDRVVDIGCDHAYLGIYLTQNNLCKNVIAADINENALQNAINNIKKSGYSKKIKCIQSDGLEKIDMKNIDTIVIAGMGTKTIKHILDDAEKLTNVKKIIISSNNEHYELRKYMQNKSYILEDEKVIYDKKHYYIISKYTKGTKKLSKREMMFGIIKKENQNYYKNLLNENKSILKKIPLTKIKARMKLIKENRILKKIINTK